MSCGDLVFDLDLDFDFALGFSGAGATISSIFTGASEIWTRPLVLCLGGEGASGASATWAFALVLCLVEGGGSGSSDFGRSITGSTGSTGSGFLDGRFLSEAVLALFEGLVGGGGGGGAELDAAGCSSPGDLPRLGTVGACDGFGFSFGSDFDLDFGSSFSGDGVFDFVFAFAFGLGFASVSPDAIFRLRLSTCCFKSSSCCLASMALRNCALFCFMSSTSWMTV